MVGVRLRTWRSNRGGYLGLGRHAGIEVGSKSGSVVSCSTRRRRWRGSGTSTLRSRTCVAVGGSAHGGWRCQGGGDLGGCIIDESNGRDGVRV